MCDGIDTLRSASRGGRAGGRVRGWLPLPLPLPLLLLLACGSEPGGDERYVSHFGHGGSPAAHGTGGRHWMPESRVDTALAPGAEMGMFEVTAHPDAVATPEQQRAAEDLRNRCLRAAIEKGWFDLQRALSDGFEALHLDSLHYGHRAFYLDDAILDPERPENLLFFDTSRGRRLVGFMFMARTPTERGPQIGGPLTVWHFHRWSSVECAIAGVFPVGFGDPDGRCEEGIPTRRSPEMLHVWLVDHPEGPFATRMEMDGGLLDRLLEARAWRAVQEGWGRF